MEKDEKKILLKLARKAIENWVRKRIKIKAPYKVPEKLKKPSGVFVTIYKKVMGREELRGCIGLPYPTKPLVEAVIEAAVSACEDPRFAPLSVNELRDIVIEVSVLTEPEEISYEDHKDLLSKITPFKDGLIISKGFYSGLFLPQVWEEIPTKEEFLSHLCLKAGLPSDCWLKDKVKIYRFRAEVFKENV